MIEDIKKLKCGKVILEVELEKYTSYKLKEKAKILVIPDNLSSLMKLLKFIQIKKYPYKIIGGGSNLIFASYYDGILIKLDKFDHLKIVGTTIEVGPAYPLMKLALKVSRMGFTGLEFATGIPGTIGGAIYNNSGAYGSDMGYIVKKVTVITPSLEIKEFDNKDLDFHYRTSFFKENSEFIIINAIIELKKGKKEEILDIIEDRKKRRLLSQPLEYPSAGSTFRNPEGLFAGKLIEDIGFKGLTIGDASVSVKHANFIVNKKNATGKDIVLLIDKIKEKVKEVYDIDLILEQEIVK